MDDDGLILQDTITNLLENKIVLIISLDSVNGVEIFEDIQRTENNVLGDPASISVAKDGMKLAGTRIIPLVIEQEAMDAAVHVAGLEPIFYVRKPWGKVENIKTQTESRG